MRVFYVLPSIVYVHVQHNNLIFVYICRKYIQVSFYIYILYIISLGAAQIYSALNWF